MGTGISSGGLSARRSHVKNFIVTACGVASNGTLIVKISITTTTMPFEVVAIGIILRIISRLSNIGLISKFDMAFARISRGNVESAHNL